MSFTFKQAATPVAPASNTTQTITYSGASVLNNLLVLIVASPGGAGISSVTATSSTTNVAVTYATAGGGGSPPSAGIYYALAGANTTVTWTVNFAVGTTATLQAYEWSGVNVSTPFDQGSVWTNSSVIGTTATGVSASPGHANELAISALMLGQQNAESGLAFGGGYTQRDTITQGVNYIAFGGDQVLSGSPSTTPSATWTGSGNHWGIAQAFFIPAASGGGGQVSFVRRKGGRHFPGPL